MATGNMAAGRCAAGEGAKSYVLMGRGGVRKKEEGGGLEGGQLDLGF